MNNPIIDELEKAYLGKELPEMNAGDTVTKKESKHSKVQSLKCMVLV